MEGFLIFMREIPMLSALPYVALLIGVVLRVPLLMGGKNYV